MRQRTLAWPVRSRPRHPSNGPAWKVGIICNGKKQLSFRPGEQALLDDRVDAPVAVDDLGDSEIDRNRDQRDRLILAQSLRGHQEGSHLSEGVLEGEIHGGLLV